MTKRKAIKSKALTDHALAAAAGVAESTWRVHKQQGAPRPRNAAGVERWIDAYTAWRAARARRPGPAPSAPGELGNPKLSHWSTERMRWLAVRNRTAALREVGLLVRRDEVVEFAGKACLTVTQRLNQLVQKLGSQFGTEVMEAVQLEVNDVLASFERGLEPAQHGLQWPEGTAAASSTAPPDPTRTNNIDDTSSGTVPNDDDDDDTHDPADVAGDTTPPADAGNP